MKSLVAAFLISAASLVGASICPNLYPKGFDTSYPGTQELCNTFYVSVYDQNKRAVLFVSEYLDPQKPIGTFPRISAFRRDNRVSGSPSPADYSSPSYNKLTGFDKGHMVPAQDSASPDEMRETFLMTNMTPQNPRLNSGVWRELEERIRSLAKGIPTHVVTVAVYSETKYFANIPVPRGYWKIVYQGTMVRSFFAENSPTATVKEYPNVDVKTLVSNNKF